MLVSFVANTVSNTASNTSQSIDTATATSVFVWSPTTIIITLAIAFLLSAKYKIPAPGPFGALAKLVDLVFFKGMRQALTVARIVIGFVRRFHRETKELQNKLSAKMYAVANVLDHTLEDVATFIEKTLLHLIRALKRLIKLGPSSEWAGEPGDNSDTPADPGNTGEGQACTEAQAEGRGETGSGDETVPQPPKAQRNGTASPAITPAE